MFIRSPLVLRRFKICTENKNTHRKMCIKLLLFILKSKIQLATSCFWFLTVTQHYLFVLPHLFIHFFSLSVHWNKFVIYFFFFGICKRIKDRRWRLKSNNNKALNQFLYIFFSNFVWNFWTMNKNIFFTRLLFF